MLICRCSEEQCYDAYYCKSNVYAFLIQDVYCCIIVGIMYVSLVAVVMLLVDIVFLCLVVVSLVTVVMLLVGFCVIMYVCSIECILGVRVLHSVDVSVLTYMCFCHLVAVVCVLPAVGMVVSASQDSHNYRSNEYCYACKDCHPLF